MAKQASPYDPSDEQALYAAVGRLAVAWGRFEGQFTSLAMEIFDLPAAVKLRRQIKELPTDWRDRKVFWKKAFSDLPELAPMQEAALFFIQRVMQKVHSRRLIAEAMWGEFLPSAQPSIVARRIRGKKKDAALLDLETMTIPVATLVKDAEDVNALNEELSKFQAFVRQAGSTPAWRL